MSSLRKSAIVFVGIGIILYLALYAAAEWLALRTGDANPFFKMATVEQLDVDWLILGASHAMTLDFADFEGFMETETGHSILNLATPGTGPLYNLFVLDRFLEQGRARQILYVVDSFAFYAPAWNEDRFTDAKLMRRMPFTPATALLLVRYCLQQGVDPRAALDYASGFSKINNADRFQVDIWEGEAQFDRSYRRSDAAERKRIEYLYPAGAVAGAREHYLDVLRSILRKSAAAGAKVVVVKMPLPGSFRARLPDEAAFDERLAAVLASEGVALHDFSAALDDAAAYFDTDHLNRSGLTRFFNENLKRILLGDRTSSSNSSIGTHRGPVERNQAGL